MEKNVLLKPILKWVGGKRQLLDEIIPRIPECSTYVEPFVGGGAVLLSLQPQKAIINDYNEELMNVYVCVRDHPDELLDLLKIHAQRNSSDYFYSLRSEDRKQGFAELSRVEHAARVIYLNKTCYNGLYRVNAAGQFNSPYGRYKHPAIVNEPAIRALSKYLSKNVRLMSGDYACALKGLRKGAFVYFDPPYMPISSSSAFTGYTEGGFDFDEQLRLKEQCDVLASKGIHFLESNSDTPEIRELYKEYEILTVNATRAINSKANRRGAISEVLIHG
ncbi:DNA adenine methylase [Bifidobacterium aquikefiricola]|uniref:Site-specific DNA-methyltransferase (adenine-specific) n=1 Tax=Bifidobacterium aquikefiricola TaxID=3059038 RepID=A0AB39U8F9_9BIFI